MAAKADTNRLVCCVDCKHYVPPKENANSFTNSGRCSRGVLNLVTGEYHVSDCWKNRTEKSDDKPEGMLEFCGRDGKFFEPSCQAAAYRFMNHTVKNR